MFLVQVLALAMDPSSKLGPAVPTQYRVLLGVVMLVAALLLVGYNYGAVVEHQGWVAAWGIALTQCERGSVADVTLRQTARTSTAGTRMRILLSNEFGTSPLVVAAARATFGGPAGSSHALRFDSGSDLVVIAPGMLVRSDPLDVRVDALALVHVDIFLPEQTALTTCHRFVTQPALLVTGNRTGYAFPASGAAGGGAVAGRKVGTVRPLSMAVFVRGVEVYAPSAGTLVALGDSITDGVSDLDRRQPWLSWPDRLAELLWRSGRHVAVVNSGVSGGRLLHGERMRDGEESALQRFERDVLHYPGLTCVVILLGTNDVLSGVSGTDVARGLALLARRAKRVRGVSAYVGTLPPFRNRGGVTDEMESNRVAVNNWIRTGGDTVFDGIIDFDAAIRDGATPTQMLPRFDAGDHLHPSAAGYEAMAHTAMTALSGPTAAELAAAAQTGAGPLAGAMMAAPAQRAGG